MGQLCLSNGLRTDIEPSKGFAKRHSNFIEVTRDGEAYDGVPVTRLDMMRAIAQGLPDLSDGARCLLGFYISHLDTTRLSEGRVSVWPGNAAACEALGKKDPTVRRLKNELEKAGFIIRRYDKRNRPLEGDAIDLSPLLVQIPSILSDIEMRANARHAAWQDAKQANKSSRRSQGSLTNKPKLSGEALEKERLNSPFKKTDSCINFDRNKKARRLKKTSLWNIPLATKTTLDDQKTINDALALSSKLKAALDPEGQGISPKQAAKSIWSSLPKLFPEDAANSINHTFLWCAQRHGAKAFLYLAIALEDPTTRDPRRLFGWFATNPDKIDVSRNLERIHHKPRPIEETDLKPNLPGNIFEDEIGAVIAEQIGIGNYNSWFAPQSIRYTAKTDKLIIEHGGSFAREQLKKRFGRQLEAGASLLGFNGFEIKALE
ncbi:MAG: helix-turn-helix domain-containing protein [Pseudomonadota bacterium]